MKKYIGVYIFLLAILLIMFITGGIHQGNIVRELEMGDACKTTVILLTYMLFSLWLFWYNINI